MKNGKEKSMFVREYLWRDLMTVCGLFVILLTIVIGAFLVYKGSSTFLVYRHSFLEFLGSADWAPEDNMAGGGSIGALIFIAGSLCTCGLALLIATPFSLGSAIFITPGSRDLCRNPIGCLRMGGTHSACTGDQDRV